MKLLADARQSPVIALMKSLDYQGNAGVHRASLSDTLVAKAQNIFGKKDDPQAAETAKDTGPLSASFGPVLRLVGHPSIEKTVGTRKLLSMLGLAGQRTRTAEGLAGVLQHAVPDARITVAEFHPVWIHLTEFEPTALGENCVLGRGFYDRGNCVRVVITPITCESVLGLTPGRQLHGEIMALLRFYLGYEANAHLEMHVSPELMPRADIASDQVRLGYTSQLEQLERPYKTGVITRVQLGTWNGQSENTEHRNEQ
ncbi:type VI secretion system baseplate subunit TssG [Burkholderia sp. PAMC 28687]|uniref:type VI secretion system baseplate subunit TssG n=1 Tax=Burkholderia sp. PAMC 28687 TaxID=1795874 RepID=UPI0009E72E29